jgi:DNA-binding response OmpR family regulator
MRARVLVVDDDPALAEMLGIVLRGEGFDPAFVADGGKAVQAYRDLKPDIVLLDGESVALTPLEFDLLVALARKPRQVFTREVLLEQVWGYRHAADTRLVNVHVQRLRSKIERDPEHPQVVLTVRGVGYKAGPP